MELQFGDFTLNTESYELRSAEGVINVEPLVFDLICHFSAHPGQVLSREDLLESVWQGRIVSDATISTCVKSARKALGDTGDSQRYLQTVRGRGYRFVAQVTETSAEKPARPARRPKQTEAAPSLLILPLRCLANDAELHLLAAGVSADLSTILTRIPLLKVSAEGDSLIGDEPPPTARQLHDQFGVDFVLDGSVQKSGGSARINAQLSDAKTGYRIWAEVFTVQEPLANALDICVSAIVGKVEPQLHKAMYQQVCSGDAEPTARQLFLEASGLLVMQGWNHESFAEAGTILARSANLDPRFALAPALQSLLFGFGSRIGLPQDPEAAKAGAKRTAEEALKLDSMDSTILGLTGCGLADVGEVQRGELLLHAALDLNPANAQAWVALGGLALVNRNATAAIEKLSKGISISPLDSRLSVWGSLLSIAYLLNGELGAAVDAAEQACRRHDRNYLPRLALGASRFIQGETELAVQALADARRIKPDLSREQVQAITGKELSAELIKL